MKMCTKKVTLRCPCKRLKKVGIVMACIHMEFLYLMYRMPSATNKTIIDYNVTKNVSGY